MAKYEIEFSNGYCGCDETEEFEGTYEEAEQFANEHLYNYAESFAHVAFGWDEEYTEKEYEDYFEGCGYCIIEIEEGE